MSLKVKEVKDVYKVIDYILHLVNHIFNGISLIHSWGCGDTLRMNLTLHIYIESDNTVRFFQHFITSTYISYYKGTESTSNTYTFRCYNP